ncbi:MAG TPA: SUMF1/EgtB/PvdO family nonheme iron enzyme [Accumulibacter sp.]|nr:SUMF1/EgtB/PvdO family nonheme iron enzyme [Accumulibacter sp.]HMY06953.1 SUMF1/EgtB/PvdO family nonheme iron enzyme [Accumulibacter sp.]HNC17648.1 SUMF1/EgtB/PvdO family nonheme iron enzyme [Accumulibacter sp.]HND80162.1 SUMF1/EgtB/PvdO family nonheme iron enzyme [Accumulibacter sp.]HNI74790.1 SUMF1/EgtB/PvdO family nonheme iron enzyme [Accumulibacter sp.]
MTIAGDHRVLRGGSWNNNGRNVRSANRNWNEPGNRNDTIGFRLAPAQCRRVRRSSRWPSGPSRSVAIARLATAKSQYPSAGW